MDAFLKSVLKTNVYQKTPLTGDGGLRSYTRIQWNKKSGILVSSFEKKQRELFLLRQKELASVSIQVPHLRFIQEKGSYIFLEDLGDVTLEKMVLNESPLVLSYYHQALDHMRDLQQKAQVFLWKTYSSDLFLKEMLWTQKYLIKEWLNIGFTDSFLNGVIKEWEKICSSLVRFPSLPAHRDYHSRNLMIKNQKIYMIDFQDAGVFPRFYDLASLLYDPYTNLSDLQRENIIQYGVSQGFFLRKEILSKEFQITVVQRLFKACGNFAGFLALHQKDSHLKYSSPSLNHIELMLTEIKEYPYFLDMVRQLKKEVFLCL